MLGLIPRPGQPSGVAPETGPPESVGSSHSPNLVYSLGVTPGPALTFPQTSRGLLKQPPGWTRRRAEGQPGWALALPGRARRVQAGVSGGWGPRWAGFRTRCLGGLDGRFWRCQAPRAEWQGPRWAHAPGLRLHSAAARPVWPQREARVPPGGRGGDGPQRRDGPGGHAPPPHPLQEEPPDSWMGHLCLRGDSWESQGARGLRPPAGGGRMAGGALASGKPPQGTGRPQRPCPRGLPVTLAAVPIRPQPAGPARRETGCASRLANLSPAPGVAPGHPLSVRVRVLHQIHHESRSCDDLLLKISALPGGFQAALPGRWPRPHGTTEHLKSGD